MNKSSVLLRIALVAVVLVVVTLFFVFQLYEYVNLEFLQQQREAVIGFYETNSVLCLVAYFCIYAVATGLSLPGAAIMTLFGGAVFGLTTGTIVVSFASTLGATLSFLLARYLLRDWVQRKFGPHLRPINNGIEREGIFYLFALRLAPLFPFVAVNLVMALTPIRVWTYVWVSQLGMLAGTIVYVNAGRELGQLDSLRGILSPTLWISFVLLGIFPFVAKKLLDVVRKRRQNHAST